MPAPLPLSPTTSICIVARHALHRAGLRAILADNPGLRVVGEARDAREAVQTAATNGADVVLLNESMSAEDAAILRNQLPGVCIVALTESAGSDGILCVPADGDVGELCSVLGAALGGRCAGCAFRARCPARDLVVALSPRETQVAVYVSRGLSSKQIAGALGISLRTVHTYRESLARKLGASSAAVLTRYVLEHQLAASV